MDEARRVLQVAVDDDDGCALGVVKTCAECSLVAEVTAKVDDFVVRVPGEEAFHDFSGAVLGTVVYENEFVFDILELFLQDAVGFGNDLFFIKNRYNYG